MKYKADQGPDVAYLIGHVITNSTVNNADPHLEMIIYRLYVLPI